MNNLSVTMAETTGFVSFPDETLKKIARERLAGTTLIGIVLRQATTERLLKYLRGVDFRHNENTEATSAYRAMSINEFEGINARQQWANWRTVPRNLNGRIPNRPLSVIDLCCGVGHSTEVLACYLPAGSDILGLEYNPKFVEVARTRKDKYRRQSGEPIKARFAAQSVLETFRDDAGQEVTTGSVDLVNCCGAVGVHFKPEATRVLAREVARVLRSGGLATIDSGPYGTTTEQLTAIFEELGFKRLNAARSCFVDYSMQVCFQKG
jgi:SAM-dependent methyltransferase